MTAEFVIRRVGMVGLGQMGHAFAVNLVEDGYQVSAYDRDPKRTAAVAGARPAMRLADLAACEVVLTSLPDDDALAAVALGSEGLSGVLGPGAVHISMGTVSPAVSPRSMRATTRIMSPHRCWGTPISRGSGSSSCSPRDSSRRWKRSVRCSSGSANASS
jgi:3-hydroxyisobutyrate dehydrogenase-like beta-hydroxyacid dehydrogenase